jgi:LmbE family N-acetylglucosaminyl deacetylase
MLTAQCDVKVVLVTDGSGAGGLPEGSDRIRQGEFKAALDQLGVNDFEMLGCPDGAFSPNPLLEKKVLKLLSIFQPDWVFLPSPLDYHRDHIRISVMLETLCRRCKSVTRILFYEIWAPVPATHVVDITQVVYLKRSAICQHRTALSCGDYLGAVEGLNRYRGLYLGRDRVAEAFWVESVGHYSIFRRVRDISLALLGWMMNESIN